MYIGGRCLLNVGINPQRKVCHFTVSAPCESEEQDLTTKLKALRVRNIYTIIITHIHINSIRSKNDLLAEKVRGNINILTILQTKFDDTFPTSQFISIGLAPPFRFD